MLSCLQVSTLPTQPRLIAKPLLILTSCIGHTLILLIIEDKWSTISINCQSHPFSLFFKKELVPHNPFWQSATLTSAVIDYWKFTCIYDFAPTSPWLLKNLIAIFFSEGITSGLALLPRPPRRRFQAPHVGTGRIVRAGNMFSSLCAVTKQMRETYWILMDVSDLEYIIMCTL